MFSRIVHRFVSILFFAMSFTLYLMGAILAIAFIKEPGADLGLVLSILMAAIMAAITWGAARDAWRSGRRNIYL